MTTELQQFGVYLRETIDDHLDAFVTGLIASGTSYQQAMFTDDLRDPARRTLLTISTCLENDDMQSLAAYGQEVGLHRARGNFALREMQKACSTLRHHIWLRLQHFLRTRPDWPSEVFWRLEDFLYVYCENYVASVGEVLEQARAEVAAQSRELEQQRQVIRELGAPIMPVQDGILVLPLIGSIDSQRALQIMEDLLEAITHHQADQVIIDITGVPTVDTGVANHLLQAARAANLVGAHIILVGISTHVAQTMVQLGVDFSSIATHANLQEGLEYAYHHIEHSG